MPRSRSREPGETTTETFKPEARATSELVQPCFKLAAPEEMAFVYLTPLEQDDNETREQMLTRTSLGAEELFGAAIKSPPTVVRAAENGRRARRCCVARRRAARTA